jgi:voltage-gated potassium channel Kch
MKKKLSFFEKLRYYFENELSKGPTSLIKWLAIVSILVVFILGICIEIFGLNDFVEGSWQSLMAVIDPGYIGGAEHWGDRIILMLATIVGIFIFSILIATISAAIDGIIENLRKGKSNVLESNHTLILGWSDKIFTIISELVIANENQHKPSIVILADRDKMEMDDEIKAKVDDFKNTRVVIRSGSPLDSSAVNVVNPNEARSIIVLSPEDVANPDTHVIKSVLALTNGKNRKKEPYHIVAEIKDMVNLEAAELVGNNETIYVFSSDLISRITAQTCRQSGLSVVYSDLLQFDGDELYFSNEPKMYGKTFKEAIFAYETSSIIGIFTQHEKVLINPPMDTIIQQGDQLIALSEDDDTIVLSNKTNHQIQEEHIQHLDSDEVKKEKTLVLGWNSRGNRILEELDHYVQAGSEVMILAEGDEIEEAFEPLSTTLKNNTLKWEKGSVIDRSLLDAIQPEKYDYIIVLSYTHDENIQESDARTLICLLHLRNISEKHNKDFSIVSEMLDIKNRELGIVAKADDFIVSDNLISLMLTQMSENKELKKVYDVLFESEGSEIYLKPVSRYVQPNVPINLYTLAESAAQLNEVFIGYRIVAQSQSQSKGFGVKMNPNKSEIVTFAEDDMILVLSED